MAPAAAKLFGWAGSEGLFSKSIVTKAARAGGAGPIKKKAVPCQWRTAAKPHIAAPPGGEESDPSDGGETAEPRKAATGGIGSGGVAADPSAEPSAGGATARDGETPPPPPPRKKLVRVQT